MSLHSIFAQLLINSVGSSTITSSYLTIKIRKIFRCFFFLSMLIDVWPVISERLVVVISHLNWSGLRNQIHVCLSWHWFQKYLQHQTARVGHLQNTGMAPLALHLLRFQWWSSSFWKGHGCLEPSSGWQCLFLSGQGLQLTWSLQPAGSKSFLQTAAQKPASVWNIGILSSHLSSRAVGQCEPDRAHAQRPSIQNCFWLWCLVFNN